MITVDDATPSQGQCQLMVIARASVADPRMRILYEATSYIDTRTERLIEQWFDMLMKYRAMFVIAHLLSMVRNTDPILAIEGGKIIEQATIKTYSLKRLSLPVTRRSVAPTTIDWAMGTCMTKAGYRLARISGI